MDFNQCFQLDVLLLLTKQPCVDCPLGAKPATSSGVERAIVLTLGSSVSPAEPVTQEGQWCLGVLTGRPEATHRLETGVKGQNLESRGFNLNLSAADTLDQITLPL